MILREVDISNERIESSISYSVWIDIDAERSEFVANRTSGSLVNLNMSRGNMRHVDLSGIRIKGCEFTFVDLSYADMSDMEFHRVVFNRCNMTKVNFEGAFMGGVTFLNCNLTDTGIHYIGQENGHAILGIPITNGQRFMANSTKMAIYTGYEKDFSGTSAAPRGGKD